MPDQSYWIDASHGEKSDAASRQKSAFPVFEWLGGYQKDWLQPDVIAGLTAAAVVIPKAMAYATIAGLPVQVGLIRRSCR
jgi:MFS superfamily sulfate permease-like transporter